VIEGDEKKSESSGNTTSSGEIANNETTSEQPHQMQRESR